MNPQEKGCEAEGNCETTLKARDYFVAGAALAAGAALGAAVMYLADPDRGRTRRSRLEERAAKAARRSGRAIASRAEDLLNRAEGVIAQARAALGCDAHVDDAVLADRVRSRIGHVTEHAHEIQTEAKNGLVTLRGSVSRAEEHRVVAEIRAVAGVERVRDLLVRKAA